VVFVIIDNQITNSNVHWALQSITTFLQPSTFSSTWFADKNVSINNNNSHSPGFNTRKFCFSRSKKVKPTLGSAVNHSKPCIYEIIIYLHIVALHTFLI